MNKRILFAGLSALFVFMIYSCEDDDSSNSDSTASGGTNPSVPICVTSTVDGDRVTFSSPCGEPDDIYRWLFGDGNESNLPSPSHLYADTGVYQVELRLTKDSTIGFTPHAHTVKIEPLCVECKCRFPTDSVDSYFNYCDTKSKSQAWCVSNCTNNQFCNSCQ